MPYLSANQTGNQITAAAATVRVYINTLRPMTDDILKRSPALIA